MTILEREILEEIKRQTEPVELLRIGPKIALK